MRHKTIIYTCSAIKNELLISEMIEADSIEKACEVFEEAHKIKPESIFGPFFKKRTKILDSNREIRFSFGSSKKGIYNDWFCTALPLIKPSDCFYLLFDKRIDGTKSAKPAQTIINQKDLKEVK
jgi:hypothetical protein